MAKAKKKITSRENSKPKYPYTSSPGDLKRLLKLITAKPKPPKLVTSTANTWGIKNTGVGTTIRVLKEIGLIDSSGVPTADYVTYMTPGIGGSALGQKIKERYKELFDHQTEPQNATNDELKNFFNIHSGGSEKTIEYQMRTFKALVEFASFDEIYSPVNTGGANTSGKSQSSKKGNGTQIHFDLHIHLPEGKTTSDYESIIRSISDHIVAKFKAD